MLCCLCCTQYMEESEEAQELDKFRLSKEELKVGFLLIISL